jgi:hypothetical protein
MTAEEINKYWKQQYPECPPIPHYLKLIYKDRWLRIHTLPESKRYAETEQEYDEILRRHNTLLNDLLGERTPYVLITVGYSDTPEPTPPNGELDHLISGNKELVTIGIHQLERRAEPNYWHLYFNERRWVEHSMDDLLKKVADDEIGNVLFISIEKRVLYHPYDGGADIVVESEQMRDLMRAKYQAWLSKHPDLF